jgi:hypothetical protein
LASGLCHTFPPTNTIDNFTISWLPCCAEMFRQ